MLRRRLPALNSVGHQRSFVDIVSRMRKITLLEHTDLFHRLLSISYLDKNHKTSVD